VERRILVEDWDLAALSSEQHRQLDVEGKTVTPSSFRIETSRASLQGPNDTHWPGADLHNRRMRVPVCLATKISDHRRSVVGRYHESQYEDGPTRSPQENCSSRTSGVEAPIGHHLENQSPRPRRLKHESSASGERSDHALTLRRGMTTKTMTAATAPTTEISQENMITKSFHLPDRHWSVTRRVKVESQYCRL
jgi:hypothetical protein